MSILDQNDSLHNNDRQINLLHQKSHSDMRFRFRDFLQYVTVHPNFSVRIDVLSERYAHLFFEPSEGHHMNVVNVYGVRKYA